MSDGHIQVFNSGGSLVADENTPVMHCINSGTFTASTPVGADFEATVTVTANNPFVLLLDTDLTWSMSRAQSGSSWTITVANRTSGKTVNYWIFDMDNVPAAQGSGSGGLEIYNASGVRTFSSNVRPMKIVAVLTGSTASIQGTYTYTTGHVYVGLICQNSCTNEIVTSTHPVTAYQTDGVSVVSVANGIQVSLAHQAWVVTPPGSLHDNVRILVIDVTNI